ncbi:MAG: hypothetical protein ABIO60_02215 [Aquaticitalea sp.]
MLAFVFLYFIGKYFYKLAEKFNKNKWLFAIFGVIVYYVGTFIGGVVVALVDEFAGLQFNWENDLTLGLIALPFGIAIAGLFYYILKTQWEQSVVIVQDEIQNIGKTLE